MNNYTLKIFNNDDGFIEIAIMPSGNIVKERLSPDPANDFWSFATFKDHKGKVICGLPVTDDDGLIKTFNTGDDALEAAIKFFGI